MEKIAVISALAALAQETRLDVFRLLVRAGPEGLSAGAIAEELELPSATLSFHRSSLPSRRSRRSPHGDMLIRGEPARWARHDPRPCQVGPSRARTIFEVQQRES